MSKKKQKQNPQHWRGHDVTGALAYVQTLMAPGAWDELLESEKPKTDREAARFFFEISVPCTMGDFLQLLKAYTVEELDRLSKVSRLSPKKQQAKPVHAPVSGKRPTFPDFLVLPADVYDSLLKLVRWADDTPACVELSDRTWDSIVDMMATYVDDELDRSLWPGVYVESVQIETPETSQCNICPGTLVALLGNEDQEGGDTEHHCVLVRRE